MDFVKTSISSLREMKFVLPFSTTFTKIMLIFYIYILLKCCLRKEMWLAIRRNSEYDCCPCYLVKKQVQNQAQHISLSHTMVHVILHWNILVLNMHWICHSSNTENILLNIFCWDIDILYHYIYNQYIRFKVLTKTSCLCILIK